MIACNYQKASVVEKQMKFLLPLIAGGLLAGCATEPIGNILTPFDNGREIRAVVGQVLVVELPSNRTTGYCWQERRADAAVVEKIGAPAYMQDAAPFGMVGMVGVGGKETWRFRVTQAGRQTLRLDYARPWENGVPPVKTVSFNVVATGAGQ